MKLLAFAAATALSVVPAFTCAEEIKIQTKPDAVYSTPPTSGGVAASSFDFEVDPNLVAAIVSAGGTLLLGGILYTLIQDENGNVSVTTTTN